VADMTRREHYIRNVGAGLLLAGAIGLFAWFRQPLWDGTVASWQWLFEPSTSTNLWYYFLLFWFLGTLGLFAYLILREMALPEHCKYKEDEFHGIIWRWSWKNGREITDVDYFCPFCDRMLTFADSSGSITAPSTTEFFCDACCKRTIRPGYIEHCINDAKREIEYKVRQGMWKQAVAETTKE
jgi:hypothetical protein